MATTLDFILDTNPYKPPKGDTGNTRQTVQLAQVTPQPAQQQQPVQTPVQTSTDTETQQITYNVASPVKPQSPQRASLANAYQEQEPAKPRPMSMADFYVAVNGAPPGEVSKEEQEKQRKRHKRNQIFAAIGDGIAALSNLYFTTQYAPNMYTPTNTLSEKEQERYDKIKAANAAAGEKRVKWYNDYMKAQQADLENARADRKEKADADQKAKDNEFRQNQFNFKIEQQQRDNDYRDKELEEKRRQFDAKSGEDKRQHDDNVKLGYARIAASLSNPGNGSSKRKRIGFSDGDKNQVSIHEDVWSGSMQAVYDTLAKELEPTDQKGKAAYNNTLRQHDTAQKKADFVKKNWYKGQRSREIMLELSKLDPATMDSRIFGQEDDDDSPQWKQHSITATPNNKKKLEKALGWGDDDDEQENVLVW